ncbi:hypothetical protein AB1Y20_010530 [Prymnesium parvum]|uniref:Hexosyltransferase n=1 Tax=Prymnesium parvum TaxID=97485 RepID=A0AB34IQ01_PRYPA
MRPWLVFTSAGDKSNVAQWLSGSAREFDLFVVYYGDLPEPVCALGADRFVRRKGGKFPNLKAAFADDPAYFASREAVFVMDDDVEIDCAAIHECFRVRRQLDAWVLQPAYDLRKGKSSHELLRSPIEAKVSSRVAMGADMAALAEVVSARKFIRLGDHGEHRVRYVNFIEVTCPLFRNDILLDFLAAYDGQLVGWGIDWWFCQRVLGQLDDRGRAEDKSRRTCLVVLDSCVCVNPLEQEKKGAADETREIDKLQSTQVRANEWGKAVVKFGLRAQWMLRSFSAEEVSPGAPCHPVRPFPSSCGMLN